MISAYEPHREWSEAQVGLGRNAVAIYQDQVEAHGFVLRLGRCYAYGPLQIDLSDDAVIKFSQTITSREGQPAT